MLYREELEILTPYFEGAKETVIILPKKNGKSTLIGALALFHLLMTPFANCIIVASTREQAEIILEQIGPMIRQSAALKSRMTVLRREIISKIDGGKIRVLAADEDSADGVLPTLAIVDELHRAKSFALYGVLNDGLDARNGQQITISTSGATLASPLGSIRTKAYEMPGFVRDHKRRKSFVRSPDGSFAFFEWCLDVEDNPDDLKLVKIVNPAPWHTIEKLRRRKESPSMTPWRWLRFACGVWTEGEEPWVEPAKWDALAGEVALDPALPTTLAIGVGRKGESGAIAKLQVTGGVVSVHVEIAGLVSLPRIEARIRELTKEFRVTTVVYGSKLFRRSADMLEAEGIPMLEHPITPERMVPASGTLYECVEEKTLRHDGDPELRAQVLAGRVKDTESGWRFVQDPNIPRPIDALIALAIGTHTALTDLPSAPLFAWA